MGLADSTIRNDTGHLDLIRDWFGRPAVGRCGPRKPAPTSAGCCGTRSRRRARGGRRAGGLLTVPGTAASGRDLQPDGPSAQGSPAIPAGPCRISWLPRNPSSQQHSGCQTARPPITLNSGGLNGHPDAGEVRQWRCRARPGGIGPRRGPPLTSRARTRRSAPRRTDPAASSRWWPLRLRRCPRRTLPWCTCRAGWTRGL